LNFAHWRKRQQDLILEIQVPEDTWLI
jgi:hypothetical protein